MYVHVCQCIYYACTCLYSLCTLPLDSCHECSVLAFQMDNIWHSSRPCTDLTPTPHIQRYSRLHQPHEPAVYDSALLVSSHCQALPSDQLCQEIPTRPASSHQSTLPVWLAVNAEQDEQSCTRTPTILDGKEGHRVGIGRVLDSQQTQFRWA